MIIPLDKLQVYNKNKYIFTRAVMRAVDKIDNVEDYPESDHNWKVVPNMLKIALNEQVQVDISNINDED